MKIIFAGTPKISADILNSLIQNNFTPISILTQPDRPSGRGRKISISPVKELANKHQIPVYQPSSLKKNEDIKEILKKFNPDLMIVIAYGLILPKDILNIPKKGCLNIHMSILPKLRGAAPIQYSILNGDKETGVTLIDMDEGMDTGDIYTIQKCQINDNDTTLSLHDKLSKLGSKTILDFLKDFSENIKNKTPQDHSLATYTKKIIKSDAIINWEESNKNILNKIKAFNPWPIASTVYNEIDIKILEAIECDFKGKFKPGTIVEICKKNGLIVSTNNGFLKILKVKIPGGKPIFSGDLVDQKKIQIEKNNTFKKEQK